MVITPNPLVAIIAGATVETSSRKSSSSSSISLVKYRWRRARRRTAWPVAASTNAVGAQGLVAARPAITSCSLTLDHRVRISSAAVTSNDLIWRITATRALRGRHLHLPRPDLRLLTQALEDRRANLIRRQQRLQHEHALVHAQRTQPGAVTQRERASGQPVRGLQRLPLEHVRTVGPRRRLQEVGAVKGHRIHLVGRDEPRHLDLVGLLYRQGGRVLLGEDVNLTVLGLLAVVAAAFWQPDAGPPARKAS